MAFTQKIRYQVIDGGGTQLDVTGEVTAEVTTKVEVAVADASTDDETLIYVEMSNLKMFVLTSDQDVTVETNDGSSPDDTFTLLANIPYTFLENGGSNPLSADITAIYVTNASGSTANVKLYAGWDNS